jgi:hypothetical protein
VLCAQPLSLAGDWSSGGVRLVILDESRLVALAQVDAECEWVLEVCSRTLDEQERLRARTVAWMWLGSGQ